MNRKQKIIVSITGIFLVLMILVGLTYAYFLTKITGNINEKSISVTTANLVLEYGENTNVVQGISNAEPGYSVEKIFTATNKGNSTVTYGAALENIVNGLSRQQDLVYTLACTSYLKSGFSLSSDGTITGTVDGTCNGVSAETKFPSTSDLSIMVNNTIDTTHTQAYKLTITYKEMGVDQSEDMNKTFSAKVNIVDLNAIARKNPYEDNKNSLAYNIINNAMNKTNGTELVGTPKTIPLKETAGIKYYTDKVDEATDESSMSINTTYQGYYWTYGTGYTIDEDTGNFTLTGVSTCKYNDGTCHETLVGKYLVVSSANNNSSSTDTQKNTTNLSNIYKVTTAPASSTSTITMKYKEISSIKYSIDEKELSIASDDYGISYYFRGAVEDNYVNYAGMCWRIVRIQGDGSIKLILASELSCSDTNVTTSSGYATDGAAGVQGTELTATYGYKMVGNNYINDYINSAADTTGNARTKLNAWLERKITNESDKALLKNETWCIGDQTNGYDNSGKIIGKISDLINSGTNFNFTAGNKYYVTKTPSYKCETTGVDGEIDINKVGMLTMDEVAFAGESFLRDSPCYLNKNATSSSWWILSPSLFEANDSYVGSGRLFSYGTIDTNGHVRYSHDSLRVAVSLKSSTTISSGDGTVNNAYTVE